MPKPRDLAKHAANQRAYRKRHPERVKAGLRQQYAKNAVARRAASKEWYQSNREKMIDWNRSYRWALRYGITDDVYRRLNEEQGAACAMCRVHVSATRHTRLCIDHDHQTKQVRGLLCERCNRLLGYYADNIGLLWKAIMYLQRAHGIRDVA